MNRNCSLFVCFKRVFLVGVVFLFVPLTTNAQFIGTCQDPVSRSYLDINNVRALIENKGRLFYQANYKVPAGGDDSVIWSAQFLIIGLVEDEIAGTVGEGQGDLWAGPVFPDLKHPPNCDDFDRIYKINRDDIVAYQTNGKATSDLRDWPTGLGAPTLDKNGHRIIENLAFEERLDRKINLEAGELPEMLGDQMHWWIMNDLGNVRSINTRAIGMEVHGTAFGLNVPGSIGNTTFYKFRVINKSDKSLDQAYIGMYFDSDVGNPGDDFVGVDTTRGLGYSYNADNEDEGRYGSSPPAVGVDFFQGPLVNTDGRDNDLDGIVDEEDERIQMTSFSRALLTGGSEFEGTPRTPLQFYNVMQGRWKDGPPMTVGGVGREFSTERTTFQFSGAAEHEEYWSEVNIDRLGTPNEAGDRTFFVSSGPFSMQPGEDQEIVLGIVWSRGTDNLDSLRKLKVDDTVAQAAFDFNFNLADVPSAPRVTATSLDGSVILEWTSLPTDNNYLDSYREKDVLAEGDYVFEGYKIIEYESPEDQQGKLLATYDVVNGITRVIEGLPGELNEMTADGSDSGIQHSHVVEGLVNYRTYFFGLQAYAYNKPSIPQIYASPVTRVEVVPTRVDARDSGTILQTMREVDIEAQIVAGTTDGSAGARITNPAAVSGHEYQVVFREDSLASNGARVVTYDIIDADTGEKKHDGRQALRMIESRQQIDSPDDWETFSQRDNIAVIDGLEFDVNGPQPGFKWFYVTQNANGPLDLWTGGAADWIGFPVPSRPGDEQQATNDSKWFLHTGGDHDSYEQFISRVARNDNFSRIVPYDWEMRFTGSTTCYPFSGGTPLVEAPFELWRTGIATPADPSDDTRVTCWIVEGFGGGTEVDVFDIGGDSPVSGSTDDPYSDWIYWVVPEDDSPGDSGYQADLAEMLAGSYSRGPGEALARTVLVNWNGGSGRPYTAELPEPGTIFRIESTKPNAPGLIFGIETDGYEVIKGVETAALSALEQIGIVPNPYKGASAYEVSQRTDEVRFTNMPPRATIRIFDLAGTLIRRLEKNSSEPFFPWNLRTDEELPIASGIYFIHVEVPGVGERAFKFAVIRKGTRIDTFF